MDSLYWADTIRATAAGVEMAEQVSSETFEERLGQQLYGLIDFPSTLTQRLLQLEQRLQALEQQSVESRSREPQFSEELLQQGTAQILALQQQLAQVQAKVNQPQFTVIEGRAQQPDASAEEQGQTFEDGDFLDEQSTDITAEELTGEDDSESSLYSA